MDSFWRLLESLREKPPVVRTQAAFLGALSITAIIGFVWITTLPAHFSRISTGAQDNEVANTVSTAAAKVDEAQRAMQGAQKTPTPPTPAPETSRDTRVTTQKKLEQQPVGTKPIMIEATSSTPRPTTTSATSAKPTP